MCWEGPEWGVDKQHFQEESAEAYSGPVKPEKLEKGHGENEKTTAEEEGKRFFYIYYIPLGG